jgi:alkaline phosphatase D
MVRPSARLALLLLVLAPVAAAQPARAPAGLRAGPMLGPATLRDATVWVMTDRPGAVTVDYTPVEQDTTGAHVPAVPGRVTALAGPDGVASIVLTGLEPGTRYAYALTVDGQPVERPYPLEFRTQALWQYRRDPPAFTVAVGSCAYVNDPPYDRPGEPYGGSYRIFEALAARRPDAMVWLGDNTYLREVDWESPEGIAYRFAHTRALPELQPLWAAAPHYATWDDHDFGPNDSDRSYVLKSASLATFRRFWPNPTAGLPGVPGVFTHFRFNDAEFFLLDDRYYRSPNASPPDSARTMLGEAQLRWFLDALTSSRAPFKVVAIGGQFLNPNAVYETYANVAPEERERLLGEIARRRIEGVVFLSGDRHHTELLRLERPGLYPLYEFTSSPLTAGATREPRDAENAIRVPGTLVAGRHTFGTLTFEGPRTARVLTMRTYDADGALVWEHVVPQADLRVPDED